MHEMWKDECTLGAGLLEYIPPVLVVQLWIVDKFIYCVGSGFPGRSSIA